MPYFVSPPESWGSFTYPPSSDRIRFIASSNLLKLPLLTSALIYQPNILAERLYVVSKFGFHQVHGIQDLMMIPLKFIFDIHNQFIHVLAADVGILTSLYSLVMVFKHIPYHC